MKKSTRKKIRSLEKRISDIESQLQCPQATFTRQLVTPNDILAQILQESQYQDHKYEIRANLNGKTLFEKKTESFFLE